VNKTIVTSAGALLAAVTMLSPTAEAGFKFHIGFGFPVGGYSHPSYEPHRHWRERVYVERKERVRTVRRKTSPVIVAKEVAPADDVAVENENSSISVAALPATDAATNPATAEDTSATPLQPVTPPQKDAAVAPTDLPVTKATEQATATPIVTDASPLAVVDPKPATPIVGQKTAKKLDCKTFFPSVGLTLSVPCG
jgi:hypothetical protein